MSKSSSIQHCEGVQVASDKHIRRQILLSTILLKVQLIVYTDQLICWHKGHGGHYLGAQLARQEWVTCWCSYTAMTAFLWPQSKWLTSDTPRTGTPCTTVPTTIRINTPQTQTSSLRQLVYTHRYTYNVYSLCITCFAAVHATTTVGSRSSYTPSTPQWWSESHCRHETWNTETHSQTPSHNAHTHTVTRSHPLSHARIHRHMLTHTVTRSHPLSHAHIHCHNTHMHNVTHPT